MRVEFDGYRESVVCEGKEAVETAQLILFEATALRKTLASLGKACYNHEPNKGQSTWPHSPQTEIEI